MIDGAHVILYSADAVADRAFYRDVLGLPAADAGGGWLVFAVPPTEMGIHPAATGGTAEFYLTTPDVVAFVDMVQAHGVATTAIADEGWGLATRVTMPSGAMLGVYQPRHVHAR